MNGTYNKRGLTVVELLVVVAIMAVIASLLVGAFGSYARYQEYRASVSTVALLFSETQAQAKVALQDQSHGVQIGNDTITQFTGDAYSAAEPSNDVTTFDSVRFIVDLTNGVDEVRINKVTGLPNATGTVEVVGTRYVATTTFTISASGVIEYE